MIHSSCAGTLRAARRSGGGSRSRMATSRSRRGRRGERRASGDELVQHDAEAVAIGAAVDAAAARLLGRHVGDRADDHAGAGLGRNGGHRVGWHRGRPRERRDAEIEDLHVAVRPQHQVVGLDVAVHDRGGVRGRERRGGLNGDVEDLAQRERTALQPLAHRFAFDEFGNDEARRLVIADFVDGQDVRMIERRRGPRFLQKPGQPLRVGAELASQHFQRDLPAEHRVGGAIHLAHAAAPEQAMNLIAADGVAGGQ